jgi:hypothetical protein
VQPFKGIGTTQYCSNPCPSDCTCWGIFYFNKMDNLELLQEIRKILDEKNKSILSDD